MKLLAIDTTTRFLCLGLYAGSNVYEYTLDLGRRQSALLLPTIKRALCVLGWRLEEIDYFACGLGPGSFTGIRVGLSTIKGLAWAMDKPVVGVSTLDVIASGGGFSCRYIVPAIDAKRSLIYCGIYSYRSGYLKRIKPYMLIDLQRFLKCVPVGSLILGDALAVYGKQIGTQSSLRVEMERDYWYPKPRNLISLALEKIKKREIGDTFDIKPIYLYPKDCQVKNIGLDK